MNAPSFRLRAYAHHDLAAIQDFWVAAWTATGIPIDFAARRGWLAAHLRSLQTAGVSIVVATDAGDRPIGFVTIDEASGHLDQLCVARNAQGGGLARALVEEAKRRSPGRIDLTVNDDNARAMRFYVGQGFAIVGQTTSASSGLPATRMRWPSAAPS